MLTTHIKKENIFGVFLSFANFYLFLVMQIFMDFMQGFESSKDKWYKLPLVGVLPQASASLRLVGVETRPAAVGRPLLLSLQLQLLHVVESLASDAAVLGMSRYVGVAFLVRCRPAPAAHLAAGWWRQNLGARPSV